MQTPTYPPAAGQRLRRLAQQATLIIPLLLPLLPGCGGGDPEPEKLTPNPNVDCVKSPETCK